MAEGLTLVAVDVPGELRSATIVLEDSGRATVLNEPGAERTAADRDRLIEAADGELASGRHRALACSGSLPPGLPDDAYARLVDLGRERGSAVVVDAAREALAAALVAGPDLVTPNLEEAEGLATGRVVEQVAHDPADHETVPDRALAAAATLLERGARRALVTAGEHGAAYADGTGRGRWLSAPQVRAANPIGAGDALVGGVLSALESGDATTDWEGAVRHGLAVASAAVEHPVAGRVDADRVAALVGGS